MATRQQTPSFFSQFSSCSCFGFAAIPSVDTSTRSMQQKFIAFCRRARHRVSVEVGLLGVHDAATSHAIPSDPTRAPAQPTTKHNQKRPNTTKRGRAKRRTQKQPPATCNTPPPLTPAVPARSHAASQTPPRTASLSPRTASNYCSHYASHRIKLLLTYASHRIKLLLTLRLAPHQTTAHTTPRTSIFAAVFGSILDRMRRHITRKTTGQLRIYLNNKSATGEWKSAMVHQL
jgi:hypothetical protein